MRLVKGLILLLGGLLGAVYLLNPGAGVIELIPDALPVVGNLDEAAAIGLLISCVKGLRSLRRERRERSLPEGADRRLEPGVRPQDFRKAESTS
ncbi:MAG: DUF1232 domain-containing protein [Deltaproteobacteria bacterium]|nr:DUF1232 domain-containing protein [Deltaproteobacteria bacterium]